MDNTETSPPKVRKGDTVRIMDAYGNERTGVVASVQEFWDGDLAIEGTDPTHGAFYWKSWEDGGRVVVINHA